jgi:hypothetical protein
MTRRLSAVNAIFCGYRILEMERVGPLQIDLHPLGRSPHFVLPAHYFRDLTPDSADGLMWDERLRRPNRASSKPIRRRRVE